MNFKNTLIKISKKVWEYLKVARIELIIIAAVIVLDLITKSIAAATMDYNEVINIIPNFFNLHYYENTAAAFGFDFGLTGLIGKGGVRIVFLIVTFLAMGVFCFFMYRFRGKHIVLRVAFALIISGAFGNFFDRLFLGYVRDFAEIVYFGLVIFGSETFAIFNLADAALTVGVVCFAVYYIIIYKEPKKEVVTETLNTNSEQNSENNNKNIAITTKNDNCEQIVNESGDENCNCEQIVNKNMSNKDEISLNCEENEQLDDKKGE